MASFKDIQSELFKKHGVNEYEFKRRSKSSSSPEQYKGMTEMDSILKKYKNIAKFSLKYRDITRYEIYI
jgi:hypothetical protein